MHIVHNYDDFLAALDGKTCTLDGVHGHIRVERRKRGSYYGGGVETHITHEPSARGKRSEAYRKLRREMGDDWSTDLTNVENIDEIARKCGVEYR